MNPKAYRLPTYVLPRRYDVEIEARLGSETFKGSVVIQLEVTEPRDLIELHALDLQISEARLTAGRDTRAGSVEIDGQREIALIRFPAPLPVGNATLELVFEGTLCAGLQGLYLAADGREQMLATQCEATDARRIFPCFDEPVFKALFAYRITTDAQATVLANGPLDSIRESADGDSRTWSFAPTKPMSTYLVAFVAGDIASTPEEIVHGTPIRVWGLRGKEHLGQFAHDYTARLLPWYEDYFGVPYHYDKYDQVAVPGFAAGAMENCGLVLFRQSALLMDPRTTSWNQEQWIALVVAHEFAHMWFGNLVTMQWWDDLWLNEAFAEWIAVKVVDQLSPDYLIWDDFQNQKRGALATDALETTHPIYNPVSTPAEAQEMFDSITYVKGCSVLRMLENFLGDTAFRAGIQTYMREFGERNAVGADLWRHLQNASNAPVTAIMQSWITQSGYPVVTAALEGEGRDTALRLRQERFYSSPHATQGADQRWHVPLVIRYEDGAGVHELRFDLAEQEDACPLAVDGTLRWCYANANEIGFYRQQLDEQLLDRLLRHLDRLAPSEQMGLLGDQWALARAGRQNISRFLDVLAAMSRIDNYNVTGEIVDRLQTIEDLLDDAGDEAIQRFHEWVDATFAERQRQLGFEPRPGESRNDAQQRVHVVNAMATIARDEEALSQADRWAECEACDAASVDPNLASIFINASAQAGDARRFDRYLEIYQSRRAAGAAPQQTNRYLYSFTSFRDPALVRRTLALLEQGVLPQESIASVLIGMLRRRHSQEAAWEYIKQHWSTLRERTLSAIPYLVGATGSLPISMRDDVVAFFDANLDGLAPMSYARALEAMDQLAEFKARTREDLIGWFARQGRALETGTTHG